MERQSNEDLYVYRDRCVACLVYTAYPSILVLGGCGAGCNSVRIPDYMYAGCYVSFF